MADGTRIEVLVTRIMRQPGSQFALSLRVGEVVAPEMEVSNDMENGQGAVLLIEYFLPSFFGTLFPLPR